MYAKGYMCRENRRMDATRIRWHEYCLWFWSCWIDCISRTNQSIGELKTSALSTLYCLQWGFSVSSANYSMWSLPCDINNNNSITKRAINIIITGERLPRCIDLFASGFGLVIPKSRFLKKLSDYLIDTIIFIKLDLKDTYYYIHIKEDNI